MSRPLKRWYFTVDLRSTHFGYVTARTRADARAVVNHERPLLEGEELDGVDTEVNSHGRAQLHGPGEEVAP